MIKIYNRILKFLLTKRPFLVNLRNIHIVKFYPEYDKFRK